MQTIPPAMLPASESLVVSTLGERLIPSPLALSTVRGDEIADYVPDDSRVFYEVETRVNAPLPEPILFEKAGPREKIFFDPKATRVGIVTCGGLCPGINNVLRSMVLELHHKYGVDRVLGFRYGYSGLDPATNLAPVPLTPANVQDVHRHGGSFLGLSRGMREIKVMVDTLEKHDINVLFAIGGDGTLRGANAIWREAKARGLQLSVVGVPKTIDNDIEYIDKTFGYETAVEIARQAVDAAHTEAIGAFNGIGIVKLMGRASGFIAASATIASREVNYCLIPEVRFDLEGPQGLFASLERRLEERHHAVIVVAEGCSASLNAATVERDASGNLRYSGKDADVGTRLRDAIIEHFDARGGDVTVKYIDPSYMIRSVPANAHDSVFCDSLARNAVHAGMAGKTDIVIGRLHRVFTHLPLAVATSARKRVNPDGALWLAVTEATGQARLHG